MRKYEGIFILKPDLKESDLNSLASYITDTITKNKGTISLNEVWLTKRKLTFPIKKYNEGTYYRVNFEIDPKEVANLRQNYQVNEDILRIMITSDFIAGAIPKEKQSEAQSK